MKSSLSLFLICSLFLQNIQAGALINWDLIKKRVWHLGTICRLRQNMATRQNMLPLKYFVQTLHVAFFRFRPDANMVLGDDLPWTNMD